MTEQSRTQELEVLLYEEPMLQVVQITAYVQLIQLAIQGMHTVGDTETLQKK